MMLIELAIIVIAVIVVIADFFFSFKSKPKIKGSDSGHTDRVSLLREELERQNSRIVAINEKLTAFNGQVSLLKEEIKTNSLRLQDELARSSNLTQELFKVKQQLSKFQEQALDKKEKKAQKEREETKGNITDNYNNIEENADEKNTSDLTGQNINSVPIEKYNKLKHKLESKSKSLGKTYLSHKINNIKKSFNKRK